MALIVEKFGGSSLADVQKLRNAAAIAASDYTKENSVVVVVSAQGDTTDNLLELCGAFGRHVPERERDALLATGEQVSAALMAMALCELEVPAVSLCGWQAGVHTDGNHGAARIEDVDTARIRAELAAGRVVVAAGFQGLSAAGDITTIGRGGSDTTAVALAAALGADVCRIYTDVDGVYSADPRIVPSAVRHYEIDYDEMLELATLGAQVLHNRSVEMAKRFGVQLEVRNSFKNSAGTRVREVSMEKRTVSGTAQDRNVALCSLERSGDKPDGMYRLLSLLAQHKIHVDTLLWTPASAGGRCTLTFSVPRMAVDRTAELVAQHASELGFEGLRINDRVCKISVVGAGMVSGCGVAAQMLEALYQAGVEVLCVTTSEIKISVIVPEQDGQRALSAVHDTFF